MFFVSHKHCDTSLWHKATGNCRSFMDGVYRINSTPSNQKHSKPAFVSQRTDNGNHSSNCTVPNTGTTRYNSSWSTRIVDMYENGTSQVCGLDNLIQEGRSWIINQFRSKQLTFSLC